MKYILIMWFVGVMHPVTAEFDDKAACKAAADTIAFASSQKDANYPDHAARVLCMPKGSPKQQAALKAPKA